MTTSLDGETSLGATRAGEATHFRVWAPFAERLEVLLYEQNRYLALEKDTEHYFSGAVDTPSKDLRYSYRIDGTRERPDPASGHQPEGVHGPSSIVDHTFAWTDEHWAPPALEDSVIYELHTGTFSEAGTFTGIIPFLPYLQELGVTTIQLMPVAQFPGARNWGYDGVQLYAPHHDYGGSHGLKTLVNACHEHGLAVYLDVVYNHLGPEGNYLREYGPYFTDQYRSPWGDCVNLDGPYSDHVRLFFIQNAVYWLDLFHFDGLRLDATHALFDFSARPFLAQLSFAVEQWALKADRSVVLIAENDQSDRRLTLPREQHGLGLDGQWLDDMHHALHVALTGEQDGYYLDYQDPTLLAKVLREGFAYSGQYAPARKRRHGTDVSDLSTNRFVVATQTHDQVGNRMRGERLSQLTDFSGLKLAAGLLAVSPYVPMLFMGQEYGETAPFMYFVSHSDEQLVEAVRQGRAEEFKDFDWAGPVPDPQAADTFSACRLNHPLKDSGTHSMLFDFYKTLLALRRTHDAWTNPDRSKTSFISTRHPLAFCMQRSGESDAFLVFMNVSPDTPSSFSIPGGKNIWTKIIDSNAPQWTPEDLPGNLPPDAFDAGDRIKLDLRPASFAIYQAELAKSNAPDD